MSDQIYTTTTDNASQNFVVVAQTASPMLVLTKRNFANGTQRSYDSVKHFNFFERELWDLSDLYTLSLELLSKPRCCFIRARIKDLKNCKHVVRTYKDENATLVIQDQNWFALDIDGYDEATGNIARDLGKVLSAVPESLMDTDCFAVASSSYGIKPGIRMRVFFWAENPVSNQDLKWFLASNKVNADLALYNPIQPIYTAAPIGIDPVKQRTIWYDSLRGKHTVFVKQRLAPGGGAEKRYTKQQGINIANKTFQRIGEIPSGTRHDMLYEYSRLLGKLVWQELIDEDETIDNAFAACDCWYGKRDKDKDMKTIRDGIDRGKKAMEGSAL